MTIFEDTSPQAPRTRPLRVAILGCSGSIGTQALDVCRRHPNRLRVTALSVLGSTDALARAAREFRPSRVAVADPRHAHDAALAQLPKGCEVVVGEDAAADLARADDVDLVLVAVVGFAGIRASLAALEAGKVLAPANKEALVVGGELLMPLARPGRLIPVDSEHSAIYQCLVGERQRELARVWLTCSGGPFYGWDSERLRGVTAAQALAHPTWSMGPKITVDSATLMNKGLEVIEAHHLFGASYDQVSVVVHRESRVHSLVEFCDGSVKAQVGPSDMRLAIQYAMSYPERWDAPAAPLDLRELGSLSFGPADAKTFRCLALALRAGRAGGTAPCVMNAANEVANQAFREGRIGFCDIAGVVEDVMGHSDVGPVEDVAQLVELDARAREAAWAVVAASGGAA